MRIITIIVMLHEFLIVLESLRISWLVEHVALCFEVGP